MTDAGAIDMETASRGAEGHVPPPRPVSAERMREWVRSAQCGAELRYARGVNATLAAGPTIAEMVLRLAELGYVSPLQRRRGVPPGQGVDYLVQRTGKPIAFKDRL